MWITRKLILKTKSKFHIIYLTRLRDRAGFFMQKSFFNDVIEVVRLIPKGRITSYGAIAKYLGSAQSSRMVGWALNQCIQNLEDVPAHRVVNRMGLLTGKIHFIGESMESKLEKEGIKIKNDQVVEFEKLFWDPAKDLEGIS